MKKITLILVVLSTAFFQEINAQCTAIASAFGNNTSTAMYNISGANSVQVVLNTNNTITLNLMPNFVTANGPDVKAYLVAPGAMTDFMLKNASFAGLTKFVLGAVSTNNSPASGAKTFTVAIPAGQNISNYSKVFFHCDAANQFWDLGTITAFTNGNCAVLGTDVFDEVIDFKIYPNPASNILNIDNQIAISSFKIFNTLGSLILEKNSFLEKNINISNLNNGVYFIEVVDIDNNKSVKRFVKQI
jgi:Secretion system C-terminal sorting domain